MTLASGEHFVLLDSRTKATLFYSTLVGDSIAQPLTFLHRLNVSVERE
jgi:hypothetical protein